MQSRFRRSLEDIPIYEKIPLELTEDFVASLWSRRAMTDLRGTDIDWDAFFPLYTERCRQSYVADGQYLSIKWHAELLLIVHQIAECRTYEEISQSLNMKLPTDPGLSADDKNLMIKGSIRLATRVFSMVDTWQLPNTFSGLSLIEWDGGSLRDCLCDHFQARVNSYEKVKLDTTFNARNLERIAGIQILWTDNLAEHLRLVDEDRKVCIFHQISFLKWQDSQIFPDGFIEETRRTLSLLFPQSDSGTRAWLDARVGKMSQGTIPLDRQLTKCRRLRAEQRRLRNFPFWSERLEILKQEYDQSVPRNLSQWWHDRRNSVQWYTFWVAVLVFCLTVFFGLVQSIEGAMQVYKAYHPSVSVSV